MAHHAFFVTGELEDGIARSLDFVRITYRLSVLANPNVLILRHGLLSVEDARRLRSTADLGPTAGTHKVLVITASRLFHEAQNALLKLFEEPPEGTILILVIPSEGMLLPTLRSRLLALPHAKGETGTPEYVYAETFLEAAPAAREKYLSSILDRTKSEKEEEKQAARLMALQLFEELARITYQQWIQESQADRKRELQDFLYDLARFIPILHERSGPLKLMFEHVQMVLPQGLSKR
jgi:hypothetical protein